MAGETTIRDLVARLRLDVSEFERAEKGAAGETAVLDAALKKVEGTMKALEAASLKAESGSKKHASAVRSETSSLESLGRAAEMAGKKVEGVSRITETVSRLGLKATGAGGGIFGGIGGVLAMGGLLALPAAGAGVLDFFENLSNKVAAYGTATLLASSRTGVNTTMIQTLGRAAEAMGVDQEKLNTSLIRMDTQLAKGGAGLKAVGYDLKSLGITAHDSGGAFLQLADYMHTHQNSVENAAIAQAFFGRTGAQLLPLLKQGSGFINDLTKEYQKYGLVLNDSQLQTAAFGSAVKEQFDLVVQGIQMQLGTQVMGAMNHLFLGLIAGLGGADAAFKKFGEIIANVVNWVASLMEGLFGITIDLKNVASVMDAPTTKLKGFGMASGDAADQSAGFGSTLKDTTAGLKEQIRTLDEYTKAQDKRYEAENRIIDASTRQLDLQLSLLGVERARQADAQAVTDAGAAVAKAAFEGNITAEQSASKALTASKTKQRDDEFTNSINNAKTELTTRKTLLAQEKYDFDLVQADKKQKLSDLLNAATTGAAAELAAFQKSEKGQVAADQSGFNAMSGTLTQYLGKHDKVAGQIGEAIRNPFSEKNKKFIENFFTDALTNVSNTLVMWTTSDEAKKVIAAMTTLGMTIGIGIAKGIVKGVITGLPGTIVNSVKSGGAGGFMNAITGFVGQSMGIDASLLRKEYQSGATRQQAIDDVKRQLGYAPTDEELRAAGYGSTPAPTAVSRGYTPGGFATGGVTPIGSPYTVGEHGPEERVDFNPGAIFNKEQFKNLTDGGGGSTKSLVVNVTVNDFTGDSDRLAAKVGVIVGDWWNRQ